MEARLSKPKSPDLRLDGSMPDTKAPVPAWGPQLCSLENQPTERQDGMTYVFFAGFGLASMSKE